MRNLITSGIVYSLLLAACTEKSGTVIAQGGTARTATSTWKEGTDYTVLQRVRIMDEMGFQQPAEAFSVLVPKGWKYEGGVIWKSLQECRGEMVGAKVRISSPDGAIVFNSLQPHSWGWASDPMMMQSLQMQAAQGGCAIGQGISAEQYLRETMLPNELHGATISEVKQNHEAEQLIAQQGEKYRANARQYGGDAELIPSAISARLKWSDGTEGIALITVQNLNTTMVNTYTGGMQQLGMSTANERSWVRFPAARKAEAEQFLANLKSSMRTNPAWKAAVDNYFVELGRQQDRQHHERMAAIDANTRAMTAAHNQRMNDIAAQGAANTARHNERMATMDNQMRSWEQQQAASDRQHTRTVQTIREVETWQGSTGAVELSSGYDQAWSRGDGTYILSNKPGFDPAAVFQDQNWTELKRQDP